MPNQIHSCKSKRVGDHRDNAYRYYITDHLNRPTRLTNQKAQVIWAADYLPFGEVRVNTNTTGDQNLGFSGQVLDGESGFYYNYFRDYDPSLGRYIQSDPIGLAGGLNTYAYVGGIPLMYGDPYGLAQFGFRPLGNTGRYPRSGLIPDGSSNHHLAHEQLWFDDNPSENVGFFYGDGNGTGPKYCGENGNVKADDGYGRGDYDFFGPVSDDDLMREALDNIRDVWDDNTYCLAGRNCQHFSDALREEYDRFKNPRICRLTRRGVRCS